MVEKTQTHEDTVNPKKKNKQQEDGERLNPGDDMERQAYR